MALQLVQTLLAPVTTLTLREIRQRTGISVREVAELAGTSVQSTRIFEQAGPLAIKSPALRAQLSRVYGSFAEQLDL